MKIIRISSVYACICDAIWESIKRCLPGNLKPNEEPNMDLDFYVEVTYWIAAAICIPGIIGNGMSLIVVVKHRGWFPSSLMIQALTAADLGVVIIGIFVAIYTAGGFKCTTDDVYTTCDITGNIFHVVYFLVYYCSIYSTVLLSVDKYLVITQPMFVMRVNYKFIRRLTLGLMYIFVCCLLIHHILGNFSRYPQCDYPSLSQEVHEAMINISRSANFSILIADPSVSCNSTDFFQVLANGSIYLSSNNSELVQPLLDYYSSGHQGLPGYKELCVGSPCYMYFGDVTEDSVDFCTDICHVQQLQLDPNFTAIYQALEFVFRFAVPSTILIYCNVKLVHAVKQAQSRRADMVTQSNVTSLSLNLIKIVVVIVGVFMINHLAALILFIMAAPGPDNFRLLIAASLVFAVINSSANVLIYCFFLPKFRHFWKMIWSCTKVPAEPPEDTIISRSATALQPASTVRTKFDPQIYSVFFI